MNRSQEFPSRTRNAVNGGSPRARENGGFTLVELMVSIVLLFLGVIAAGAIMVTIEQGAVLSENRFQDYFDLHGRIEGIKEILSEQTIGAGTVVPSGKDKFTSPSGYAGATKLETGAAGLPNLVRVEMEVDPKSGGEPYRIVTYLAATE